MPRQSRASGAIALLGAQATVLVLGYVTHLWVGRALGPGPYGVYGVVLSIQTIVGIFLTLGIPVAISRFVAQDESHAQSILKQGLRWQLLLGVIIAAATFMASPLIANLLNDPSLVGLIRISGLVVLLQAGYPAYIQFFSGLHRFNRQAALTGVYALAKLIGAITLLYFFSVYGALLGFAVGGAVATVLGWHWARQTSPASAPTSLSLKDFLSFASTYVLTLVGLQILMSLDLFMVKAFLKSDVQAGYYNAAVTLSRISYFLLQGIAFVLLPSVSALTKPGASRDQAVTFIQRTLRYLLMLIVPSVALAAATSRELIRLFYSSQYLAAAPILTILMVGLGSLAFYLLLANIAAGAGKSSVSLGLTVVLLIMSAIIGSLLIPRFGLIGAAWQTTITSLLGLSFLTFYTFNTFKIPIPWRSTANILIATALAVSITYVWEASVFTLPLLYLVVGILYITALSFLHEITLADRQLVARLHPALQWIARS